VSKNLKYIGFVFPSYWHGLTQIMVLPLHIRYRSNNRQHRSLQNLRWLNALSQSHWIIVAYLLTYNGTYLAFLKPNFKIKYHINTNLASLLIIAKLSDIFGLKILLIGSNFIVKISHAFTNRSLLCHHLFRIRFLEFPRPGFGWCDYGEEFLEVDFLDEVYSIPSYRAFTFTSLLVLWLWNWYICV